MVFSKPHPECVFRKSLSFFFKKSPKLCRVIFTDGNLFNYIEKSPRICHVKTFFMEFRFFCFGKQEYWFNFIKFFPCFYPEIGGHHIRNIAPESVDIAMLYPELHRIDHMCSESNIVIVKIYYALPVRHWRNKIS